MLGYELRRAPSRSRPDAVHAGLGRTVSNHPRVRRAVARALGRLPCDRLAIPRVTLDSWPSGPRSRKATSDARPLARDAEGPERPMLALSASMGRTQGEPSESLSRWIVVVLDGRSVGLPVLGRRIPLEIGQRCPRRRVVDGLAALRVHEDRSAISSLVHLRVRNSRRRASSRSGSIPPTLRANQLLLKLRGHSSL